MSKNVDLNSFSTRKKKKKHTLFRFFVLIIAILLAIIFCYGATIMARINRDRDFNRADSSDLGFNGTIDKKVINIALFGVDTREIDDFSGRSDSIMILSVNKRNNTIRLVSVMRDSLVPIEKNGGTTYNKINTAYASGGPTLAVKTLNTLYGLDIKDYATVNFYGMADIIDALGGIEVEITKDELTAKLGINAMINEQCIYLKLNPKDYFVYKTGVQKLNGVQAVAYARIRHAKNSFGSNNDFGRTERQRLVMKLLLEKALKTNPLKYPSVINKLAPYIKTSLKNSEMFSLGSFLLRRPKLEQSRIPHNEYIIDDDYRGAGASTVYYNYEYAGKVLRAFLYDGTAPEDYFKENGIDKTKWFKSTGESFVSDKDDEPTFEPLPDENLPDDTSSDTESDTESDVSSDTSDTSSDTSQDDASSDETSSDENPTDQTPSDNTETVS
ncbi:MAG: LytR family transcriptional regulator [Ruminococcaceae bacterium]|nr:LytR family transcriptional regulator [Oscillospiraceae bacterium]